MLGNSTSGLWAAVAFILGLDWVLRSAATHLSERLRSVDERFGPASQGESIFHCAAFG
jgi:hypothetical protein